MYHYNKYKECQAKEDLWGEEDTLLEDEFSNLSSDQIDSTGDGGSEEGNDGPDREFELDDPNWNS